MSQKQQKFLKQQLEKKSWGDTYKSKFKRCNMLKYKTNQHLAKTTNNIERQTLLKTTFSDHTFMTSIWKGVMVV